MRAATKTAATFGATLYVPEFLRLERYEIGTLLNVLRDPLTTHAYLLMLAHADFETGEFLGGYHRLQELCTPPQPERGARMAGPTYKQLRRVVDDLIALALVTRDAMQNALQGQLRLHLAARKKKSTSEQLGGRVQGTVKQAAKPASMRVPAASPADSGQVSGHGSHGFNTSFNGSTDSDLSTPEEDINTPPEGAQNGPQGAAPSQVEASPLMASMAGEIAEQVKQDRRAELIRLKGLMGVKQPSISEGGSPKPVTRQQDRAHQSGGFKSAFQALGNG